MSEVSAATNERVARFRDISSESLKKNSKKIINFIERNKEIVSAGKGTSKKSSMQTQNDDLVIRCLNDIDKKPNLSGSQSDRLSLETSNQIEFDISIISSHSSIVSEINPKFTRNNKLEAKSQTTTNSSLFKFDSGLTKSNFEDFDDNFALSTQNDVDFAQNVISIDHQDDNMELSKGEDKLENAEVILDPEIAENNHRCDFNSHVKVLAQGQYDVTINSNADTNEESANLGIANDDELVNIIKNDENLSKIRSRLMERSESNNNSSKKRQVIIPNLIEQADTIETNKDPVYGNNEQAIKGDYQEELLNQIASQAAMFAVEEPLSRIQSDLESKMSTVLSELELLRKNEEIISAKLLDKNIRKQQQAEIEEIIEEKKANYEAKLKREENQSRIRHLENLQEKQVDMMSQLISLIGKENTNANLTASSGRESLNRFRQQFDLSDPVFINPEDYSQHSDLFVDDFIPKKTQKTQKLPKNMKTKINEPDKTKKTQSQSRSRSRNQNKKEDMNAKSNSRYCCKTRSNSRSRSVSRERDRSPEKINRNRSIERMVNNDIEKKHTDFLKELLEDSRHKSPIAARNLESKSASIFSETIYDSQPTLFDKYLNEAKNTNKLYELHKKKSGSNTKLAEQTEEEKSEIKTKTSESVATKTSMFNDIKEVLKAVEYSRSQIDTSISDLLRNRDVKKFNLPGYHLDEKSDRIRMKKLVDGCVSAISNDVQKEVSQKLIDESKHVKLDAERDTAPYSYKKKATQFNKERNANSLKSKSSVGFGSSAARSIYSNDKKPKTQSDTSKYIGKVFGKTLLDQIKLEEIEERNKKMKQQLEEQRELKRQLDLQKQQSRLNTQTQSRLFKNISNKKENKKVEEPSKGPVKIKQKEAIASDDSQSKLENQLPKVPKLALDSIKSAFETTKISSNTDRQNVALITVTPRDSTRPKTSKDLKQQILPSLSINPTPQTDVLSGRSEINSGISERSGKEQPSTYRKDSQPKEPSIEVNESLTSSLDLNQSGTGIHLPGYHRPSSNEYNESKYPPSTSKNSMNIEQLNQLSNDTNNFIKQRSLMEKKAFDWIEQELISHFITNLANSYEPNQVKDDETEYHNGELIKEPETLTENPELKVLGAMGLRLIAELGTQVDPDFVQALLRECLEEKVSTVMQNNAMRRSSDATQPVASPRKRSIDKNNMQNLNFEGYDTVKTPVLTPEDDVPGNYTIGTQVSFEQKDQFIKPNVRPRVEEPYYEPPFQQPYQPPQRPYQPPQQPYQPPQQSHQPPQQSHQPQIIQYQYGDDESCLEETLTDNLPSEKFNEDSNQVYVPNTPNETPVDSPAPEDLDVHTISEVTPIPKTPSPPPRPPPPQIVTKSTSVQCEPEPIIKTPEPKPIEPIIKSSEPKPIEPVIKPIRNIIKQDEVDIESNETSESNDLTQSTQYTSDNITSTTQSTTKTEDLDVDESYFSDGAWLMSKSEGQIIEPFPDKAQLDQIARKGSIGEVKMNSINNKKHLLDGRKINNYLNGSESGEIVLNQIVKQAETNSEGEVINTEVASKKDQSLPVKSEKLKKSKLSKPNKKAEKTCINLSISPEKVSKNNIQIQSIPNEILVRDSTEVERKIFSSTPDQSMLIVQPLATTFVDEEDFSNYTNYEGDDGDEDEKTVELESMSSTKFKKSSKNKKQRALLGSSDLYTENDGESIASSVA